MVLKAASPLNPPDKPDRIRCQGKLAAAELLELLESAEQALSPVDGPARAYIVRAARLLREVQSPRRRPSPASVQRAGLLRWQIQRVARFIAANFSRRIVVADLAAAAGLSVSHFSFAFRSTTGTSPHMYVARYRIQRAQELMLLTERTLSDIALECGLVDQPHLTRLFGLHVGETPATWRRMQRVAGSHHRDSIAGSMGSRDVPSLSD
jgi:AraC family transcriptional regulator